jgi:hypothetical protein
MLENPAKFRGGQGGSSESNEGGEGEGKATPRYLEREYKSFLFKYFREQRNLIQGKIDEWRVNANINKDLQPDINTFLPDKEDQDDKLIEFSEQLVSQVVMTVNPRQNDFADIIDDRAQYLRGMNSLTFESLENEVGKIFKHGNEQGYNVDRLAKEAKKFVNALYRARIDQSNFIVQSEIDGIIGQVKSEEVPA